MFAIWLVAFLATTGTACYVFFRERDSNDALPYTERFLDSTENE